MIKPRRLMCRMTDAIARLNCVGMTVLALIMVAASLRAEPLPANYDDHQNMMDQLGIKKIRRGPDPNNQSTFDEATANPYTNSLPDVLTMNDGTKVTRPDQWPARRAEIQEDFEREVYGRIPAKVPKVTWEVTATTRGTNAGIPTVTKTLVGHVDNRADTNVSVNIQASFTVPAGATAPVPIMIEFGFRFGGFGDGGRSHEPAWHGLAIAHGWGYGTIFPDSIQSDNNHLTSGIIGLTNKGQPRKPDDWGALRAWQWGVSRLIDFFETNADSRVDAKKVGIEGLSRFGKAAIVTEAFDPRVAVGLIGSSGEGGVKLYRHIFGEGVENLAGGEYYWMAGNFMKYGADEPLKTPADLPVDAHELIAMCAPRPCFISYGVVEHGDAKWVDAHGSFMAGVLAGPVYRLLGKKDFGTPGDYLTDQMPPVNQLIGGELAWRQHDGGHDVTPNWPTFFQWVANYIQAPPSPAAGTSEQSAAKAQVWQLDNGDGTFTNPPLYADFPDPDIIRVGGDFYLVTTTFVNSPGVTVLHSKDLVNWEYVSHVVQRLDGSPKYDLKDGGDYRHGFYAVSIRHHNGTFYVVVTPVGQNTRVYYSKDIHGPWQYHELDRAAFDPGFFIEDDGTGYIATSGGWDGHVTLLKLNEDFSKIVDSQPMFYHRGIEGSHVVKRHGWYYVFNALPGKLALTCSRSTNLFGPYETIEQMGDRTGGHQGGIVDLPDGSDYGFIMKDSGPAGRMTYISPIFWTNNWPVWGTPDAPGKVPAVARKPIPGMPVMQPATSDEFNSPTLGLQWQWNHNPDDSCWSLTERPGFLRLKPTRADEFWLARNTLTQKGQGPWSRGTVKLDLSHLKPGDVCGFGTLGKFNGQIAVTCGDDGKFSLRMNVIEDNAQQGRKTDERVASQPLDAKEIYLRTDLDFKSGKAGCAYSLDNKDWTSLGGEFKATFDWRTGTFQGPQFAIFCYNPNPGAGFIDVDWFRFSDVKDKSETTASTNEQPAK